MRLISKKYLVIIFIFSFLGVLSQETKSLNTSQHKIGFNYGFGRNNGLGFTNIDIDRDYKSHLFQFQYYRSLLRYKSFGVETLMQPQVNFSKFNSEQKTTTVLEFGINIGVLIRYNFWKGKMSVYGLISSGPHFISKSPSRQANNFIFSDNFFGGINYKISEDFFIDLRPGKRHMSNLNLQSPNGGINTFIFNIGILKLL